MVEINKTTLSADFPIVEKFEDYHEIYHYGCGLSKLFGRKIGDSEIGFCENGLYWGVFYVGRKPNKAVIEQLLSDAEYVPMGDEEF
ncbi:hypothetical protein LCGC14_2168480 [marine sediment metagenome]|uniref:Uncharacterized protein n=1 Tax=marine sediment metagenome TaxID=412755 RepID=A0A0F9GLQ6_9ZZZZ